MKIEHGVLYLADLSPQMGTESGKIRPVIVIQTNLLNRVNHPSTWILPCTTKLSGESLLRVIMPEKIAGNRERCEVMIDQSRTIDNKRFIKKFNPVPRLILHEIKEKLRLLGEI